jgi:NAD(P)H-dependent flavin oxidoreductase YrpB (nitropropane dioxygenase family)
VSEVKARAESFCKRFGLQVPILLAPMAGACPPSLSIAVANAGGLGACGALLMQPEEIIAWAKEVRENSNGAFQLNIWIPDRRNTSTQQQTISPRPTSRLVVFWFGATSWWVHAYPVG